MPELADISACAGLFLASFIAATLLPMQSEAALAGLLLTDRYPAWLLIAVASLGSSRLPRSAAI